MIKVEIIGCGRQKEFFVFRDRATVDEILAMVGLEYEDVVVQGDEGRLLTPKSKVVRGSVLRVHVVYCYEML